VRLKDWQWTLVLLGLFVLGMLVLLRVVASQEGANNAS
jgi:hypothetical protein